MTCREAMEKCPFRSPPPLRSLFCLALGRSSQPEPDEQITFEEAAAIWVASIFECLKLGNSEQRLMLVQRMLPTIARRKSPWFLGIADRRYIAGADYHPLDLVTGKKTELPTGCLETIMYDIGELLRRLSVIETEATQECRKRSRS